MISLQIIVVNALSGCYVFWHFRIKAFRVLHWLILFLSTPVSTTESSNSVVLSFGRTPSDSLPGPPPALLYVDQHSGPKWKLASPSLTSPDSLGKYKNVLIGLPASLSASNHCCLCQPRIGFHVTWDLSAWVILSPSPLLSFSPVLGIYDNGSC